MENQQLVVSKTSNALSHIKIMNKLGTSFFIMFLVGAMLPLVDLGDWSKETLSLYNLAEPTLLMILAGIGALVYLSGISRAASRTVSLIFFVLVIAAILSQVYDIYDLAKSAREIRGRNFEFKHFIREFNNTMRGFPVKEAVSVASVLLTVSIIGIVGGIFSPRYKENKPLKAAITGKQIEFTESESSASTESNNINKGVFLIKLNSVLNTVITKIINIAKYFYQIMKPLINSLLDKGTDIICQQQPQLKRKQVKMVLGGILAVFIYFIIF